jgi:hypothetical protein
MTTPVSFQLAKLLKEKGFEQTLEVGVICRIQNKINKDYEKTRPLRESDLTNEWSILNEIYPTIVEVVMWLYEKYGIWIEVPFWDSKFRIKIVDTIKEELLRGIDFESYNSPTEAYEAAIEYTLNNLI